MAVDSNAMNDPAGGSTGSAASIPKLIRVERSAQKPLRIFVDGQELPYCTVDGVRVSTRVRRDEVPAITITIPAIRVEVVDEL